MTPDPGWGGLTPAAVIWLILGTGAAVVVAGCGLAVALIAVRRWLTAPAWQPRDDGTRPMDLGGLVISREQDAHNAWLASCPTDAIDPADGCTWCRPGTLRAWPCACADECGDPACAPAVRR